MKSFVPAGLEGFPRQNPSDESLGYFLSPFGLEGEVQRTIYGQFTPTSD